MAKPKLRQRVMIHPLLKKGGIHEKTTKAKRRQLKMKLQTLDLEDKDLEDKDLNSLSDPALNEQDWHFPFAA